MGSEGPEAPPVGAVLAGGEGRRIGGDKAIVELEGRPLVSYPLEALHEVCDRVAVVAKRQTLLPPLEGAVELWLEPLCALYRRQALPDLERALEAGARMSDAVAALRPDELAVADDVAFLNVDRPEDLLRAATLFGC